MRTGDQRQFGGTRNITNQVFDFLGTRENVDFFFQGNKGTPSNPPPPPQRPRWESFYYPSRKRSGIFLTLYSWPIKRMEQMQSSRKKQLNSKSPLCTVKNKTKQEEWLFMERWRQLHQWLGWQRCDLLETVNGLCWIYLQKPPTNIALSILYSALSALTLLQTLHHPAQTNVPRQYIYHQILPKPSRVFLLPDLPWWKSVLNLQCE